MWDTIFPYLAALLPTVGVAVLFYFVIKAILEGDRRERLAQSKWEKLQDREDKKARRNSQAGSD
jgi:threonine/homoserine/homoserine lactone efflux protein